MLTYQRVFKIKETFFLKLGWFITDVSSYKPKNVFDSWNCLLTIYLFEYEIEGVKPKTDMCNHTTFQEIVFVFNHVEYNTICIQILYNV